MGKDSSVENVENYTKEVLKMCKIPHFPHFDEIYIPSGVPLDLKSSVKNVLTFLCFADSNPPGRLSVVFLVCA